MTKIKLSLVDKLKMSFLTDENKQKFIEEKEREARRLAREERDSDDSVEDEVAGSETIEGDPERSERVSEGVSEGGSKKKVVVVKKKKRVEDVVVDDVVVEEVVVEEVVGDSVIGDLLGDDTLDGVTEQVGSIDSFSEDLLEKSSTDSVIEDDGDVDEYLERTRREAEMLHKAELMRKKELEKAKYTEMMLNLPPGNLEVTLGYALEAGIPEWYLREEGLIRDEIDFDDLIEEVNGVTDTDSVEVTDSVGTESGSLVDVIEDIVENIVEDIVEDTDRFAIEDVVRNVEIGENESIDVAVSEEVEDDRVIEVVESSIEVPSSDVTDKRVQTSLLDRLKRIDANRVKREVLKVDGDQVFVKEQVTDRQGSVKSNYANYKVSNGVGLSVGQTLDGSETLERVESSVLIDGEDYTLSVEDEVMLRDIVSLREVWIVTKDVAWVDGLESVLNGTRYRIHAVRNERDFLMATRNVDNVIVITQQIPEEAQLSIVSYLKYLAEEKRSARLVSISSSLVNSPLIEHVFEELTEETLDGYYEEFTSDMYNFSRRPMRELLKSISFDLSDDLSGDSLEFDMVSDFADGNYEEIRIDDEEFEVSGDVSGSIDVEIDLGETFDMELEFSGDYGISLDGDIEVEVERGN